MGWRGRDANEVERGRRWRRRAWEAEGFGGGASAVTARYGAAVPLGRGDAAHWVGSG
jgi:hypothetical protein